MIFQNTLNETTKIVKNRMTNPDFNFYEDKVIQGLLKKSGHYVPPEAKASEGDETKVFWKIFFIAF